MQPGDGDAVGQGQRQAVPCDNSGRHGDLGEAGERVSGGRMRLIELSAPVGKLVVAQRMVFAESGAGEPGGEPGGDLLLPKNSAFLSGHSKNPNVDTMGFSVTSSSPGKQVPIQGRLLGPDIACAKSLMVKAHFAKGHPCTNLEDWPTVGITLTSRQQRGILKKAPIWINHQI